MLCPSALMLVYLIETEWRIYASVNYAIIGSENDLSPVRCQAFVWTNDRSLSIGSLGTNFSEILIKITTISFREMRLKMSSAKWQPFCLSLNVVYIAFMSYPPGPGDIYHRDWHIRTTHFNFTTIAPCTKVLAKSRVIWNVHHVSCWFLTGVVGNYVEL